MRHSFRRPSATMVVACIALLVALSGTSIASVSQLAKNSVGTRELKKDAVVSSKVKNRSLLAVDFKTGQLPAGPVGPQGEKGDKGDKGDAGAAGPPGVSGLEIVQTIGPIQSSVFTVGSAACPSNKRVLGGGAYAEPLAGSFYDDIAIGISYPITNTTWQASASEVNATAGNWRLRVYAICANVTD